MHILLAAAAMLSFAATANAQQPQTPPCSTPEFRQMDFWVGAWDAHYTADTSQPAGGVNVITRAYDNCVIQEDFQGGPQAQGLVGHSVSTYHAPTQQWRQTWVDNQGGYFALSGGRVGDIFVLTSYRINTSTPVQRMVFSDITENSFTWRWQASADAGATWTDSWVIHYVRRRD